jgi:hypothetical protein
MIPEEQNNSDGVPIPRRNSWARYHQSTPDERGAVVNEMRSIRASVPHKLTIAEIIASKHEGHKY